MNLIQGMVRAARFDASLYEEIRTKPGLMKQAMAVVALSAVASAISTRSGEASVYLRPAILTLAGWFVMTLLAYLIGKSILAEPRTKADLGQLLRSTGFASSPLVVQVLGIIPGLSGLAPAVAELWWMVATVLAVRYSLNYASVWRAVGVLFLAGAVPFVAGWTLLLYFMGRR